MALVPWTDHVHNEDFTYSAVVPLTDGDWTDVFAPSSKVLLLMSVTWEGNVDLSTIDQTGASEVESVFHEEDSAEGGILTFAQVIVQTSSGVGFRVKNTSGVANNVTVILRDFK